MLSLHSNSLASRARHYLVLSFLALLSCSVSVNAAVSWTFNTGNCISTATDSCGSSNLGVSQSFTNNETEINNVKVDAFSTTKDPSSGVDQFQTGTLGLWNGNGLGVQSREDGSFGDVPHHAFDNDGGTGSKPDEAPDGDVDAGLFIFDNEVALSSISIGWGTNYDSDISVMAYTGTLTGTESIQDKLVNKEFKDLIGAGWSFVGHYADLIVDSAKDINGSNGSYVYGNSPVSSSYWLISAYTSMAAFDGNNALAGAPTAQLGFGNDYFKIEKLTGTEVSTPSITQVPEPSSVMLLLMGAIAWRINSKKRVAA